LSKTRTKTTLSLAKGLAYVLRGDEPLKRADYVLKSIGETTARMARLAKSITLGCDDV